MKTLLAVFLRKNSRLFISPATVEEWGTRGKILRKFFINLPLQDRQQKHVSCTALVMTSYCHTVLAHHATQQNVVGESKNMKHVNNKFEMAGTLILRFSIRFYDFTAMVDVGKRKGKKKKFFQRKKLFKKKTYFTRKVDKFYLKFLKF